MRLISLSTLLLLLVFASCNKDKKEDPAPQPFPEPEFSIVQDLEIIRERDKATFYIDPGKASVNVTVEWFLDSISLSTTSGQLEHHFTKPGIMQLKARVRYSSQTTSHEGKAELQKTIVVAERPSFKVKVKKVEVTGYSNFNKYIYNHLYDSASLKSYFRIDEYGEDGENIVRYTSSESLANARSHLYSFQPMVWDIASANYDVKVYKEGNLFPSQAGLGHFKIVFYGASYVFGTAHQQISTYVYNLNQYRATQPTEILIDAGEMDVKLTLEWN